MFTTRDILKDRISPEIYRDGGIISEQKFKGVFLK